MYVYRMIKIVRIGAKGMIKYIVDGLPGMNRCERSKNSGPNTIKATVRKTTRRRQRQMKSNATTADKVDKLAEIVQINK